MQNSWLSGVFIFSFFTLIEVNGLCRFFGRRKENGRDYLCKRCFVGITSEKVILLTLWCMNSSNGNVCNRWCWLLCLHLSVTNMLCLHSWVKNDESIFINVVPYALFVLNTNEAKRRKIELNRIFIIMIVRSISLFFSYRENLLLFREPICRNAR